VTSKFIPLLMRFGQEREKSVDIPEIRKKFSTQFQGAKALLDGFRSHEEGEATRSEIDLVIRLHIGAEMTKLMTSLDHLQREAQKQVHPQRANIVGNWGRARRTTKNSIALGSDG
jgi:hypothetical protein